MSRGGVFLTGGAIPIIEMLCWNAAERSRHHVIRMDQCTSCCSVIMAVLAGMVVCAYSVPREAGA